MLGSIPTDLGPRPRTSELESFSFLLEATKADALISIPFRPGQFVLEGEVIAFVSPSAGLSVLTSQLLKKIELGRHRVLAQDLEFGIAQIVEIAIRALSPAVNDTFTGVASVDLLGEALVILARTQPIGGDWYDANGSLRSQVRPLLLPRLLKQSFDQIRQVAADNPAVPIRLLSTISQLSLRMQDAEHRNALLEQATAVWETATSRPLITMDREDIEVAWRKANERLMPV